MTNNDECELSGVFNDFQSLLKETAEIILTDLEGDHSQGTLYKLQNIMKLSEESKKQIERENQILEEIKITLDSMEKPWECDVHKMFDEKIQKETALTQSAECSFSGAVNEYIQRLQNEAVIGVRSDDGYIQTHKDPWTKLPIQDPVQSNTCKHFYERSIVYGVFKKKKEFRCPYLGCVETIHQHNILDVKL